MSANPRPIFRDEAPQARAALTPPPGTVARMPQSLE